MKFNTKYFGELDIEVENGDGSAFTSYDGQKLYFYFADFKSYGAKINVCLNVLDRYLQICEMAKAAIVQNFNKNETVRYYFECHFDVLESDTLTEIFGTDEFEKLDVKKSFVILAIQIYFLALQKIKKSLKFQWILKSHPSIQTKFYA